MLQMSAFQNFHRGNSTSINQIFMLHLRRFSGTICDISQNWASISLHVFFKYYKGPVEDISLKTKYYNNLSTVAWLTCTQTNGKITGIHFSSIGGSTLSMISWLVGIISRKMVAHRILNLLGPCWGSQATFLSSLINSVDRLWT